MIQCSECEFFVRGPGGQVGFKCDPFSTIKEPECLVKWQLIKLDLMVQSYQATVAMYRRLAPLQEKMFRHMEREIDDLDEGERWKQAGDDPEEEGENT
jgi:hypothetical protein